GRHRSLAALRVVEGDSSAKKLPAVPTNVAAILTACGRVRKTIQLPLAIERAGPPGVAPPAGTAESEIGEAIRSVVRAYRAKLSDLLETLPHDLPRQDPSLPSMLAMSASGPKKPDLVRVFAPLGYDCRGDSGSFTLRRRTPGNLAVKLQVDVGMW